MATVRLPILMSKRQQTPLQKKFYDVIFGTETMAGQAFDIARIMVILAAW